MKAQQNWSKARDESVAKLVEGRMKFRMIEVETYFCRNFELGLEPVMKLYLHSVFDKYVRGADAVKLYTL